MRYAILFLLLSCATGSYLLKDNDLHSELEKLKVTRINSAAQSIVIMSIADKRDVINLGNAYTGVQYNKTPVVLTTNLKDFMSRFLVSSFSKRNLIINESSKLKMTVEVNQLWVEEVIDKFKPERAKCRVDISFHILGDNKKWSGNFWAEYLSEGDMRDGTERITPTLANCLNEVIEKLVADKKLLTILQ